VSKASDTSKGDLSIGSDEDGGLHIDLMVNLLSDSSAPIQQKAQNLYLQWLASPARVTAVKQATADIPVTVWTQQLPIKPAGSRKGMLAVIPSIESLAQTVSYKALQNIIDAGAGQVVVDAGGDAVPLNLLHIVVGQDAFPGLGDRTLYYNSDSKMTEIIAKCKQTFNSARDVLSAASVGEICVVLPQPPRHPRFVMFTMSTEMDEWTDNSLGRDLWPTWVNLLELNRLKRSYTLSRIHKEVRPTSHIYLATRPAVGAAKAPHPELLMRSLHYSKITSFPDQVDFWLRDAMQEIEHALLDPQVSKFGSSVTSRIFLHVMGETKVSKDVVIKEFERAMNRHMSSCGGDMLNMAVDEIELKMRLIEGDADDITTLRLSSSSLDGGFMKTKALVETADPLTGLATRWQKIGAPDIEEETRNFWRALANKGPEWAGLLKRTTYQKYYKYKQETKDKIDIELKKAGLKSTVGTSYIGVHMRFGDKKKGEGARMIPVEEYAQEIKKAALEKQTKLVWVATENKDDENSLREALGKEYTIISLASKGDEEQRWHDSAKELYYPESETLLHVLTGEFFTSTPQANASILSVSAVPRLS